MNFNFKILFSYFTTRNSLFTWLSLSNRRWNSKFPMSKYSFFFLLAISHPPTFCTSFTISFLISYVMLFKLWYYLIIGGRVERSYSGLAPPRFIPCSSHKKSRRQILYIVYLPLSNRTCAINAYRFPSCFVSRHTKN